jgi:hypothetical protein
LEAAVRRVVVRRVPVERARVVPVARRRAVVRPPFAAAERLGARRVVLRRVPVERDRVELLARRVPVLRRVPVERLLVERDRVVPVARRRAVVRPPFAAAERDGARRVVLRRVPVERELELVERRRVPPVEREREVVLREREVDARRVPVERDRLVVERLRPRLEDELTREMPSSFCSVCSSGCCMRTGVSSWPSTGEGISPNVPPSKLDICPPIGRFPVPTHPSDCRHPSGQHPLARRHRRACRLLRPREDGALGAWP